MFDEVGDLGRYVDGWTVHPYGPEERWRPKLDQTVERLAARGAPESIPLDVTEWGLATDDGRCLSDNYGWDRCMSYEEAAGSLRSALEGMRARYGSRLRHFLVYQIRDQRQPRTTGDREHYFGSLTAAGRAKGAYTRQVRALLRG